MATTEILVVASDAALGRSIAFALESGGFKASVHRSMDEAILSPQAGHAACLVVDDDAIGDWNSAGEQFDRFARPVILLVDLFHSTPGFPLARCVRKPFLGEPLIDAVWDVIAGHPPYPDT
jgi:DNA-binding response OmpR family regulator